jgi:hypothetical protein
MSQRTSSPRLRGDGGAVVVEAAIVMPLLVLLVSGVIDYGGAFREKTVFQAATRNSARAAATASGVKAAPVSAPNGTPPLSTWADALALSSLYSGLSGTSTGITVEKVVIYRANAQPEGRVPASCASITPTGTGSGQQGLCNVYSRTQMETAGARPVTTWAGAACTSGRWDSRYCPYNREVTLSTATIDRVGVYVEATYTPFTGLFSDTMDINDYAVMAVEPNPRQS